MKHFYIIYKITNKVNQKFYIGIHKTENINDDYYGSGHCIKAAIKKYGIDKKKILINSHCFHSGFTTYSE